MYRASSSIHIHFAHHVRGHEGPCISLHGHTWKFEVVLEARELNKEGFVVDFDRVHAEVLTPVFALLDHSLAIGEATWTDTAKLLAPLGELLVASRQETLGHRGECPPGHRGELGGARNEYPGGIKIAVFPFTPTSERLAEWVAKVSAAHFDDGRVRVVLGRVYETLHPAETIAEFLTDP
jgi:6-pyruvoyl-tetrahydropterin synthase